MWLGFDVAVENGPVLRPQKIQFWKENKFAKNNPEAPFHYKADALVGLSLIHLNHHLKTPFAGPQMNFSFCHEAWLALEPHHELFNRSQSRVNALRSHLKVGPMPAAEYFERKVTEILDSAMHPWGFDLEHLHHIIEAIDHLETKMGPPLLYNFQLKFSKSVLEKLHHLHSLLFNLRTLIALDHNAYIQDPTHDALKVDSITDYLPKAEYVTNDAILYLAFKNQKVHILNPAKETMEKSFRQYCHNGYCLIEALPKSFLNQMASEELEASLYLLQMDWLLGSETGLLFKIREELYALSEGYEKIFWPDAQLKPSAYHDKLEVNCLLTESDIHPQAEAA